MTNKISLERMFEDKYQSIENYIRREFGDEYFESMLDDILDSDSNYPWEDEPK